MGGGHLAGDTLQTSGDRLRNSQWCTTYGTTRLNLSCVITVVVMDSLVAFLQHFYLFPVTRSTERLVLPRNVLDTLCQILALVNYSHCEQRKNFSSCGTVLVMIPGLPFGFNRSFSHTKTNILYYIMVV